MQSQLAVTKVNGIMDHKIIKFVPILGQVEINRNQMEKEQVEVSVVFKIVMVLMVMVMFMLMVQIQFTRFYLGNK